MAASEPTIPCQLKFRCPPRAFNRTNLMNVAYSTTTVSDSILIVVVVDAFFVVGGRGGGVRTEQISRTMLVKIQYFIQILWKCLQPTLSVYLSLTTSEIFYFLIYSHFTTTNLIC